MQVPGKTHLSRHLRWIHTLKVSDLTPANGIRRGRHDFVSRPGQDGSIGHALHGWMRRLLDEPSAPVCAPIPKRLTLDQSTGVTFDLRRHLVPVRPHLCSEEPLTGTVLSTAPIREGAK